jgi:hypothetical protein
MPLSGKMMVSGGRIMNIDNNSNATRMTAELTPPVLISTWEELAQVPPNDKYKIVVEESKVDKIGTFWIRPIDDSAELDFGVNCEYLHTHLFYKECYLDSTELLQRFGFNVVIDNWDKEEDKVVGAKQKKLMPNADKNKKS